MFIEDDNDAGLDGSLAYVEEEYDPDGFLTSVEKEDDWDGSLAYAGEPQLIGTNFPKISAGHSHADKAHGSSWSVRRVALYQGLQ